MKITWLGQAGLMFETKGKIILIDPYLSDSVGKVNPLNKRRVPVKEELLNIKPDIIVLTHDHLDHTDPETLMHYLNGENEVTVLAPSSAWQKVRTEFGGSHNYVQFNRHTEWTEDNIKFSAVKAEHSDASAIGVILKAEGKKYYITGDTLYNNEIFGDLPKDIECVFLPINGRGNNMNMADAERFCEKIGSKAVPMHCGLFDGIDMNEFGYENKIVPCFYAEIPIN